MPLIQDLIHKIEVGGGSRVFRVGAAVLAVLLLAFGFNMRGYRNMGTQEAMDAAQVGRNIAQGKGFTTLFIRPLSIYLVKKRNLERRGGLTPEVSADPAQLKGMHPDIANPPLYPLLLAGLMKVAPLDYAASSSKPFWSERNRFSRYEPDFVIGLLNQAIFLTVILLVFLLARQLFDAGVAWLSAALLLGSELLWRFSVSGLSTMFLLLIFTGLTWCVVLLEQEIREAKWGPLGSVGLSFAAGVLLGLGGLTRYSFCWVLIPLLGFVVLFGGRQRVTLALISLITFAVVMAPWIIRNYNVSGTPFGTASFAVIESTMYFTDTQLQRSLDPDFSRLNVLMATLMPFWLKLMTNLRQIVQTDLPRLGGSWISAFFVVGLLVNFRSPAIRRLRYFLLMCLGVFVFTQALGRTYLSDESPDINSENLLVLLTPFAFVYGVSLFFLLLDIINLPLKGLRYAVLGAFSVIVCLPMIMAFLPPKTIPVAYPPYYPPAIQTIATWVKEKELTMSDVPWAMAWYGQRQSVWLTLKCRTDVKDPTRNESFFAINDFIKPIVILYLTPETMDSRFLSQWVRAGEQSWGAFIIESMVKKKIPEDFPLGETQSGWMPEQLMLADWQRWRKSP